LARIWGEDAAGRQNKHVYYRYDVFARRVEKLVWKFNPFGLAIGTEWFFYLYDNEDIIVTEKQTFDFNGLNTEITHTLHGPGIDEPLMAQNSQETYYYHADGLGSITALTDETEVVIEEYSYSAFGEIKKKYGIVENSYTYTGRELDDETGLYFYRARYYDAEAGRFLSEDPSLSQHPNHTFLLAQLDILHQERKRNRHGNRLDQSRPSAITNKNNTNRLHPFRPFRTFQNSVGFENQKIKAPTIFIQLLILYQ